VQPIRERTAFEETVRGLITISKSWDKLIGVES
jgi:hypothetical protein